MKLVSILIIRFFSKIDKTSSPFGCWIFHGTPSKQYPQFATPDGLIQAHRFSWMIKYGPIPKGKQVCHNCPGGDNPRCVNPKHLWLGTPKQNSEDMVAKGRTRIKTHPYSYPRGDQHHNCILSDACVMAIRLSYAKGAISMQKLADRYGINKRSIFNIVHNLARVR